jgi:hypothetical protein
MRFDSKGVRDVGAWDDEKLALHLSFVPSYIVVMTVVQTTLVITSVWPELNLGVRLLGIFLAVVTLVIAIDTFNGCWRIIWEARRRLTGEGSEQASRHVPK